MMLYRQFATQEEIDKEYDVEKSAPDFQRYAEFNINESKKARDELECLLDVPFGPTVEETLDIFPAQDPDAPILVFIHGGYWRSNSSKEFSWVARGPVALGFTVVITNYALCPKVTLPEITGQSRRQREADQGPAGAQQCAARPTKVPACQPRHPGKAAGCAGSIYGSKRSSVPTRTR
jgi:hypothetical protein